MSIHQTDEQLRDTVQREIEWEPAVTSKDISIKVKDGVVSLNGFANSFPEKMAAERAAKSVYGVTAIANDLTVKPATTHADPEIARDVQHAFKTHVLVPDGRITVTVRDGHVTLEGAVEWNYQRTGTEHGRCEPLAYEWNANQKLSEFSNLNLDFGKWKPLRFTAAEVHR